MALEVNMRPSGGFSPGMINFARETDVYKIWADMIAYDSTRNRLVLTTSALLQDCGMQRFCPDTE